MANLYIHTCLLITHTDHMHTLSEKSLTLDNLNCILDGVQNMDYGVTNWLQIPPIKRDELQQQFNGNQLKRAYIVHFLSCHPAPSWRIVANALWQADEYGALELVQKFYLKGESSDRILTDGCGLQIVKSYRHTTIL